MPTDKKQVNVALPDDLARMVERARAELGLLPTQTILAVLELALPIWLEIQLQRHQDASSQFKRALEVALGKPLAESKGESGSIRDQMHDPGQAS